MRLGRLSSQSQSVHLRRWTLQHINCIY